MDALSKRPHLENVSDLDWMDRAVYTAVTALPNIINSFRGLVAGQDSSDRYSCGSSRKSCR